MTSTPLMDRVHNIGGTAVAGNAETALQLSKQGRAVKFVLLAVKVLRKTGASATAHQGRLTNVLGTGADGMPQFFRAGATAAGTLYSVADINQPFYTDADGTIYLSLDADAADTFEYEIWYQVLSS